jgi:hypothetical protein
MTKRLNKAKRYNIRVPFFFITILLCEFLIRYLDHYRDKYDGVLVNSLPPVTGKSRKKFTFSYYFSIRHTISFVSCFNFTKYSHMNCTASFLALNRSTSFHLEYIHLDNTSVYINRVYDRTINNECP